MTRRVVLFDWRRFLDLARRLAGSDQSEENLRTAISRAYYAAFHMSSNYAVAHGLVFNASESKHIQVWRYFSESADPSLRILGSQGHNLSDRRIKADYHPLLRERLPKAATFSIKTAETIIAAIRAL